MPQALKAHSYKVGDKIRFEEEKQAYTVQAASDRYLVCTKWLTTLTTYVSPVIGHTHKKITKPFNARHTVLYSIVDFEREIRGTENLVFCFGFETRKQCEEALQRLLAGDSEVSYRNYIGLNICA